MQSGSAGAKRLRVRQPFGALEHGNNQFPVVPAGFGWLCIGTRLFNTGLFSDCLSETDYVLGREPDTLCRANFQLSLRDEAIRLRWTNVLF
jgi:hypothetical protein